MARRYIDVRRYGDEPHDSYLYTFMDGPGLAVLSISENMAFEYFHPFFDGDHLRSELTRLAKPAEIT